VCGVLQRYKKIVKKKQNDKNDCKSYAQKWFGEIFPDLAQAFGSRRLRDFVSGSM
jgi:hypothetical protein